MRDVRDTQLLWRNHNSTTISILMDLQVLLVCLVFSYFLGAFQTRGLQSTFKDCIDPAWTQLSLSWPKILYIKIVQSLQPATKKKKKKRRKKKWGQIFLELNWLHSPFVCHWQQQEHRIDHYVLSDRKHNYAIYVIPFLFKNYYFYLQQRLQ